MEKITVTLAQLEPKFGEKTENLAAIQRAIREAANSKSNLVVFPELFLTGYSVGPQLENLAETKDGSSIKQVQAWCKEYNVHAVFGFAEKEGSNYYISAAVIDDDGNLCGIYRKNHLFSEEKKYFTVGDSFPVFDTKIGKIGVIICFDVEFPEAARTLKLKGAEYLVIINANMHPYEEYHYIYARSRAMENEIPVVICNRVGQEGSLDFCGDSMVIDHQGNVLLRNGKGVSIQTVELPIQLEKDEKLDYITKRRAELYI